MGDKNQVVNVIGATIQAKTGHSIVKAVYTSFGGDRVYGIVNNTTGTTAVFTFKADAGNGLINLHTPFNLGLRIVVVSGTTGEIVVVYE